MARTAVARTNYLAETAQILGSVRSLVYPSHHTCMLLSMGRQGGVSCGAKLAPGTWGEVRSSNFRDFEHSIPQSAVLNFPDTPSEPFETPRAFSNPKPKTFIWSDVSTAAGLTSTHTSRRLSTRSVLSKCARACVGTYCGVQKRHHLPVACSD